MATHVVPSGIIATRSFSTGGAVVQHEKELVCLNTHTQPTSAENLSPVYIPEIFAGGAQTAKEVLSV